MQAKVDIKIVGGMEFSVEHEVKTLGDLRKLLRKADVKIGSLVKILPEAAEMKLERARISVEQPKQAATTA